MEGSQETMEVVKLWDLFKKFWLKTIFPIALDDVSLYDGVGIPLFWASSK